jgi:hypothetical protein
VTVTPEPQAPITAAIAALPAAHRLLPNEKELTESKEAAFTRLQDWTFTKGFALVIESFKSEANVVNRVVFRYTHHLKSPVTPRRPRKKTANGSRRKPKLMIVDLVFIFAIKND